MNKPIFTPAILIMLCFAMLLGSAASVQADVTLVEDGKAKAAIVIEADAEHPKQAAEVIAEHIKLMSGAELPVIVEGEDMPAGVSSRIYVGHTNAAAAAGVKLPSGYDPSPRPEAFEEEGFTVATKGNDIYVGGNQDGPYRGTIYGAAHLLETLGCRWYMPGDWGRIVPEKKTVVVADMNVTQRPDFAVRWIGLGGWLPVSRDERAEYRQWASLVTMNPDPMYPLVGDGFLTYLIPQDEFFEKEPDVYAMNEQGERWVGRYERLSMLELANPRTLELSIQNLKEAWVGDRKMRNVNEIGVGISPPDGTPVSYSKESKELSNNFYFPRYVHVPMNSDEFFGFAGKLSKEFPDKWISTMAYASREVPPQGVELGPNVMVKYAPIANDVLHANDSELWRRDDYVKFLKQWGKLVDHITIYDYSPGFLTGMFVPERDVENMAINAKIYRDLGVKGMTREGRKAFMITWLSFYCTAKFLWDADTDLDKLKTEFYTDFFGKEAGPHVRAWWDASAERLVNTDFQAHEDFLINHIYTSEFITSIQPHIDKALASKSATPMQRERLDAMKLIAEHFAAFGRMNDAEAEMDYAAAEEAARAMYERKLKLAEIYPYLVGNWENRARKFFADGRAEEFAKLHAKRDGSEGRNLADLPREMKFTRDVYNEGMAGGWYDRSFDDSGWDTRDSYLLWEQQEPNATDRGHDYDGLGWYRTTVQVGKVKPGEKVMLRLGGIMNEGWIWVNGKFVGHKTHALWWAHNHDREYDITEMVEPGKENTLAIRVLNDAEFGGLYRRGFIYATTEAAE